MGAVAAGHATDLWGVGLVTLGVLFAVAFYGGLARPGRPRRPGGRGRPPRVGPLLAPSGPDRRRVRMLMGRRRGPPPTADRAGSRPVRSSAARWCCLAVPDWPPWPVAHPASASTAALSSAGGWVGAVIADPLGSALGGFGAAVVLVVVVAVALLVFTGVSVRSVASAVVRAVRWLVGAARGDRVAVSDRRGGGRADRPVRTGPGRRAPAVDGVGGVDGPGVADVAVDPDPGTTTLTPRSAGRRRTRDRRPARGRDPAGQGRAARDADGPAGRATGGSRRPRCSSGPRPRSSTRPRSTRPGPPWCTPWPPTAWRPAWWAAPSDRRSPATSSSSVPA